MTVKEYLLSFAAAVAITASAALAAQQPPPLVFTVDAFEVTGDNPLDPATTAKTLAPFTGDYDGIDALYAAKDALESALRERGFSFHRVGLPEQELTAGTITLNIMTFALGETTITGNVRIPEHQVRSALPALAPGATPNIQEISRSLGVANDHPGRRYGLNLARSANAPDTLDARVRVTENRPYAFFAGFNNIGTDETGNLRLTLGAQYNDLWQRDHVATATFSTSPDNADDVQQYGFNYRAPVYALKGWFSAFYIRSDVDVGNVQQFFDISGSGDFLGFSFKRWLYPVGRYRHSLTVSLQDRRFDTGVSNAVTGIGLPGISNVVRSRPIAANYEGSYRWAKSNLSFSVEFVNNLTFGGNNRDIDYARVRAGSEAAWNALRFGAAYSHELPRGWQGVVKAAGQYADEPLIPGEQFGLGGERSVRGFEERTIAADDGLLFNFEIWAPPIVRLYNVRFFAFADIGHKHLEQPQNPQIKSDTISSAGLGFRVNLHEYLYVSADYGHTIADARGEASDKGNVKTHFNVVLKY